MKLSFTKILFLCGCIFFLQVKSVLASAPHQNYLYVAEQSAGFSFKYGKWQGGEFSSPDTVKYYLKFSEKTSKYEVTLFNTTAAAECTEYPSGFICNMGALNFEMNKDTFRYSSIYRGSVNGPLLELKEREMKGEIIATPYIEIGACTEM